MRYLLSLLVVAGLMTGCSEPTPDTEDPDPPTEQLAFDAPPDWSRNAIWYQIFVERFRNGNPANDPTAEDVAGAWPYEVPENWAVKDWGSDWYALSDWEKSNGQDFYYNSQLRRYGGDLKGVMDKLDYLQSLGVNAIYFNPLNDAPSLHKYDARHFRHIDRHFGPDPKGDAKIIATEDPLDPSTWKWTAADQQFLDLIAECHRREMRVVLDYSWNHTGIKFWAWDDILEKQQKSAYKDWYIIYNWDDPATDTNEFDYEGWLGFKELPELMKVDTVNRRHGHPYEGDLIAPVKEHVFNVSKRWLDPNGDGDCSDGVDGYRLDVADQIPMTFWRDYRKFVRSINPEVYLVGEIWWQEWPTTLMNPRPYLGDVFDAVMHYQWYRPARQFFAHAEGGLKPSQFKQVIDSLANGVSAAHQQAMMSLCASHDSPRLSTSLQNPDRYKLDAKPQSDKNYAISRPGPEVWEVQKQLLVHQYTFVGSPHIWNGDEMGMWGADDPDCRKPLIWGDIEFETETAHPYDVERNTDPVQLDQEKLAFYQQLGKMRHAYPALATGEIKVTESNDDTGMFGYTRQGGAQRLWCMFNTSDQLRLFGEGGDWTTVISGNAERDDKGQWALQPYGYVVLYQPVTGMEKE